MDEKLSRLAGLRRDRPDMPRPYRMWFYPLPAVLALAGWLFIFVTTPKDVIVWSLGLLGAGVGSFFVWSRVAPAPSARRD